MILCQRIFLTLSTLLLLAHYLPGLFWLVAAQRDRSPIPFWSPVDGEFLFLRPSGRGVLRVDANDKEISRESFEAKLPFTFQAQLLKEGRMPKVLNGIELTPAAIREGRLSLKFLSSNFDSPSPPLYPLFESESGRARLSLPSDFMGLGKSVEFIEARTNRLDAEKSSRFREAFLAEGFQFPVKLVGGNPTTLKPYDEGYYLTDAAGVLFHLRMVKGEPSIMKVADLARHLAPLGIFVQEQESRELRAILVGANGELYFLLNESRDITPIPIRQYLPNKMTLTVRGDMLSRLFTLTGNGRLAAVATDRDLIPLAYHDEPLITRSQSAPGQWASRLFPLQWDIEDPNSGYLGFHAKWGGPTSWVLWFTFFAGSAILNLYRLKSQPPHRSNIHVK